MIRPSIFALILLFLCSTSHGQQDASSSTELKLLRTELKQLDKKSYNMVSEYVVNGTKLRLVDQLVPNSGERTGMVRSRLTELQDCSNATPLYFRKKQVGSSRYCSDGNLRVLLYTFGEKVYEISSESETTIGLFTREVLPLSCHLHGSPDCISMFY